MVNMCDTRLHLRKTMRGSVLDRLRRQRCDRTLLNYRRAFASDALHVRVVADLREYVSNQRLLSRSRWRSRQRQ